MDRITDASNGNARTFTDGNDLAGIAGTIVAAAWMMGVQEELVQWVENTGQVPAVADFTQIRRAAQITGQRVASFGANANWVVPAGVYLVKVTVVGGGGGGCGSGSATRGNPFSSGGGGGAGGAAIGFYPVVPGQVIPITVGAGGGQSQPGGTSSFGILATAYAGGGSNFTSDGNSAPGGAGGLAVGGNLAILPGGYGSDGQSSAFTTAGNGAASLFGGSGRASANGVPGLPGQAPGAGGGGSYNGSGGGGSGAKGIVTVEY